MKKNIQLRLRPEEAFSDHAKEIIAAKSGLSSSEVRIIKRSIDARKSTVWVNVQADVYQNEQVPDLIQYKKDYSNVSSSKQVVVVGAGPAGLFAALRLVELGIKPIVIERGKDVRERRRDIAAINKDHIVNPESNYCFGEGGAGTYSDGKLYTRSKKRGDLNRILEILVAHGAREEILYDAHPHIGTNKLPKIVQELRESIINAGGEVLFDTKVTDLILEKGAIKGVETSAGDKINGEAVILATGHSARDIFQLLKRREIEIEAKPFALGVRVEHPQMLIDSIQYSCAGDRGEYLPASSYSLVSQTVIGDQQRGVFSFCMCPGGFIVPSATNPGEVVVNGMSPSRRDSKFANSGIVVAVETADLKNYQQHEELAAMYFQADIEKQACQLAGGTQVAPAQRLVDFVHGKVSSTLPETSYQPGLLSVDMTQILPDFISERLKYGFKGFGKKMKGYLTNEAQIVGVESRTSSPVRIPRDKETLEHVKLKRLYPCAEGAGYAGGIVSAAMDGERCAEAAVVQYINSSVKL
ncbi:NAD(P)/FAD-dependent oxidoreductase [Fulvivirga lutimaris]|uniref:NAD(P)/FAD-dependent oxidoreductase n=1 Tax=Fulvivirga lutimaris TaxID=1819566 RepID=UPI0012BC8F04|nr:FAD-dependent oxidoreductase [Fulvivirga lutimaris]MTI39243.1 FAD-binding protein [Fulvivirga lutimaris]